MLCVTSIFYFVFEWSRYWINSAKQGLWQGDPLLRYMFILWIKGLFALIKYTEENRDFLFLIFFFL